MEPFMSLDQFATFEVKQAVINGDLDADSALVLSVLPYSDQRNAVSKLVTIQQAVNCDQLQKSIEMRSVDLSRSTFDKSACASCLHNTQVANERCGTKFKPNLCTFTLCAQYSAADPQLLAQRTIIATAAEITTVIAADHPLDSPQEVLDAYSDDADVGEADHSDDQFPQLSYLDAEDAEEAHAPTDLVKQSQSDAEYVLYVQNAWWRSALEHHVLSGRGEDMQDFICSQALANRQIQGELGITAVQLLRAFRQPNEAIEVLAQVVKHVVAACSLEDVRSYLSEYCVDLSITGSTSTRLLGSLNLAELEKIADELQVPASDALVVAYSQGSKSFANALYVAVGNEVFESFVVPSLRYQ